MRETAENEGFSDYEILVAEVDGIVQGFASLRYIL
jgi:hypothetical protein